MVVSTDISRISAVLHMYVYMCAVLCAMRAADPSVLCVPSGSQHSTGEYFEHFFFFYFTFWAFY